MKATNLKDWDNYVIDLTQGKFLAEIIFWVFVILFGFGIIVSLFPPFSFKTFFISLIVFCIACFGVWIMRKPVSFLDTPQVRK